MRNKILILIPIMLLVLALIGCNFLTPPVPEPEPEPIEELSADVVIVDWEQEEIPKNNNGYEKVKIWYRLENTGTLSIDYYQIWFYVICIDGSIYSDWTDGTCVNVGGYVFEKTKIDISGKEAIRVGIVDLELKHWEF